MVPLNIPTFVINLEKRGDRKAHIISQFAGRDEFDVTIVKAFEHEHGAIGLWQSIHHIVANLTKPTSEYILICEDDHEFTNQYSRDELFEAIEYVKSIGGDILLGGASWVQSTFGVAKNVYWVERFTGTQFVIVFQKFFREIATTNFSVFDTADHKMASLSSKIFLIHPFFSIQKEFGYSDATNNNNVEGTVTQLFKQAAEAVSYLDDLEQFFARLRKKHITPCIHDDNYEFPLKIISKDKQEPCHKLLNRNEFKIGLVNLSGCEGGFKKELAAIRNVIQKAIKSDDDFIIFCENRHVLSNTYCARGLVKSIVTAHGLGAEILLGSTDGHFNYSLKITENLFWINTFHEIPFMVLYKSIFSKILDSNLEAANTLGDYFSNLSTYKLLMFPPIAMTMPVSDSRDTEDDRSTRVTGRLNRVSKAIELYRN